MELGHRSATVREIDPSACRDRSCCNCRATTRESCCKFPNAWNKLDEEFTTGFNGRTENSMTPFDFMLLLPRYNWKAYSRAVRNCLSLSVKEVIDCLERVRLPLVDRCCLPQGTNEVSDLGTGLMIFCRSGAHVWSSTTALSR